MRVNCPTCGGPLFRGTCLTHHKGKSKIKSNPTASYYRLEWRPVFLNSHGNPTRTAQWRPYSVSSLGAAVETRVR